MGHEVQYILESKRMVWLVAVVFAVIIMFQYFEFPYGDVASSFFSTSRAEPPVSGSYPPQASSLLSGPLGNTTRFDGSNITTPVGLLEKGGHAENENDIQLESNRDAGDSSIGENDLDAACPPPISLAPVTPPMVVSDNLTIENGMQSETNRETDDSTLKQKDSGAASPPSSSVALPQPTTVNRTVISPSSAVGIKRSEPHIDAPNLGPNVKGLGTIQNNPAVSPGESSVKKIPPAKEVRKIPMGDVVTMSDMHEILLQNRATVRSMKPLWFSTVDQELVEAKMQIENAPLADHDRVLYPPLYRNVSKFKRSYELMERILKVYVYKEGEKPIFHQPQPVLTGIYASEGWFMKHMKESKHFVTNDPKQAHLFYLPFSSRMLEEKLYVTGSGSRDNLVQHLKDYLHLIAGRYDSWNRTGGSDHFLVACHDWATDETKKSMNTCIRALCNSDVKREGFELGKDVSLAETYVRSSQNPLRELGGKPPSKRSILAFFAGQMHGDVRPILMQHWENKDPDMKIFRKLPKSKGNRNYINYMKSSKYCICPKGYEVNSPRVVEAIFHECVPVIISDNFVPPFFEILNWESFAVFVQEKDIPNLKNILLSISKRRYQVMQQRVKRVQQHFLWHVKPVKYDIFHMILHSVWYNRVFRVNPF
uniref:probable glycosyltransferase At5g03795 n=1 Tax=Erigeron canadensis TaxID=72917 RepID=UPI001CB8D08F|nr:probable glycosyltransferase At5g03795 [Erigeron canadensis]